MNEKLQYAEMLEIPVNTCNVVYKPSKKKKPSKRKEQLADKLKEEIIQKVNQESQDEILDQPITDSQVEEKEIEYPEEVEETTTKVTVKKSRLKGIKLPFKANVIAVQLIVIGALLATIFLTNSLVPNSGINTFMKSLFGKESATVVSSVNYQDFSPNLPTSHQNVTLNSDGVMTINGKGSVYSPCDGTITDVYVENDKYTVEISHGKNFKTVFYGIDYAYGEVGDNVFATIPVGYVLEGGSTACFTDANGTIISNYSILDNQVVWAV